ncbi:hypothetical protein GCM10025880_60800 [Methylorubrum aminovorans]|nr:hypothetical protein GCM10025880_60800 [Methylorubrum aminovorans]
MGVGDLQDLQQALDRAVLARRAMEGVKRRVGLELGQHRRNVGSDIDAGDAIPLPSSAPAQALPERSEISRSEDQPPIRTATCLDIG